MLTMKFILFLQAMVALGSSITCLTNHGFKYLHIKYACLDIYLVLNLLECGIF